VYVPAKLLKKVTKRHDPITSTPVLSWCEPFTTEKWSTHCARFSTRFCGYEGLVPRLPTPV
jgi:hypothetical protein